MDMVSILGAAASLECAILLIAGVVFLERRQAERRRRLMISLQQTLEAAQLPGPEASQAKAA